MSEATEKFLKHEGHVLLVKKDNYYDYKKDKRITKYYLNCCTCEKTVFSWEDETVKEMKK